MTLNRNNKMNSCSASSMVAKNSVSSQSNNRISNRWFLIWCNWWSIWFFHNEKLFLIESWMNREKWFNLIFIETCIVRIHTIESFQVNSFLMNTCKMRYSFLMNIEKNSHNRKHNLLLLRLRSFSLNNHKLNVDFVSNRRKFILCSFVQ